MFSVILGHKGSNNNELLCLSSLAFSLQTSLNQHASLVCPLPISYTSAQIPYRTFSNLFHVFKSLFLSTRFFSSTIPSTTVDVYKRQTIHYRLNKDIYNGKHVNRANGKRWRVKALENTIYWKKKYKNFGFKYFYHVNFNTYLKLLFR